MTGGVLCSTIHNALEVKDLMFIELGVVYVRHHSRLSTFNAERCHGPYAVDLTPFPC